MDYQVWIKEEFGELFKKVDCGDLGAVKREVDKAVRTGQEPIVTIEVPYELGIKFGEPGGEKEKPRKETPHPKKEAKEAAEGEAAESGPEAGKDTGD